MHHIWKNLFLDMYLCIPAFLKNTQQELFALRATITLVVVVTVTYFGPRCHCCKKDLSDTVLISDGGAMQSRVLGFQL